MDETKALWETRSLRRIAPIVLAGIAAFSLVYIRYRPWDLHDGPLIGALFGRDFVNFWIGGRLALTGSLATLTDLPAYNDLIVRTFDHTRFDSLIFSYPPHSLLVFAPLASLPYAVALTIWTLANLAALAVATRRLARCAPVAMVIAVCLSPAALTMVLYGHFGGLLALALVIVLLDGERRPWIGGLCLAAMTIKPQLALALGIILLAGGRWRCLAPAALWTAALAAASLALFGWPVWRGFLTFTLAEQSRLLADYDTAMLGTTISPYLAARALGAMSSVAWLVQGLVSIGALAAASLAVRRWTDDTSACLVVALAIVICLPYANHYDLAIAAPALTLLVLGRDLNSPLDAARLIAWLAPPVTWHLVWLRLPLIPVAVTGAVLGAVPRRQVCDTSAPFVEAAAPRV